MKITIGELNKKLPYLQRINMNINDRLTYNISRFIETTQECLKKANKKHEKIIADLKQQFALTDPKNQDQFILDAQGQYTYNETKQQLLDAELEKEKDRFEAEIVDVTPRIINVVNLDPDSPGWERAQQLPMHFKMQFEGLLFPKGISSSFENDPAILPNEQDVEPQQ